MKPLLVTLTVVGILASASAARAAVDPALLALIPPDSSALFGVQVQNLVASPFGQFAVAQLPASDGMVQFAAATGFDYQHDLKELLGATSLPNGTKPSIIFARGTFQVSKFLALAAVTGSTVTGYRTAQIVTLPNNASTVVAFLDSTTVAIGTTAALQSAADRYAAHAQYSGPLAAKSAAASASADVWFATVTPLSQFMKPGALSMPGNMMQQIGEASGGLRFSGTGAIAAAELTTASAQQAQSLLTVMKFLASMAMANPMPDPNAARAAAMISAAQFSVNGSAINLTLPIPEQILEQMYSTRPKPAKKASIR